jgi:hypothetical protein
MTASPQLVDADDLDRRASDVAVPAAARWAAIVCWGYAAAFGLPAVPVAMYLVREGRLPWFGDLFPMYGGPWSDRLTPTEFAGTAVAFLALTVVVAGGARRLWDGHRGGAVLVLATLPVEAVFWFGYALPFPPLLAFLRVALVGAAWSRLRARGAAPGPAPTGRRRGS